MPWLQSEKYSSARERSCSYGLLIASLDNQPPSLLRLTVGATIVDKSVGKVASF